MTAMVERRIAHAKPIALQPAFASQVGMIVRGARTRPEELLT